MGGKTTNVTNTGLGDAQFNTLFANQDKIASGINTASTDAKNQFDTVNTNLSNLSGSLSGGFTTVQDLMRQYGDSNNQNFQALNTNVTDSTGQIQSGLQSGFDRTNSALDAGFGTMSDNMNQQFNTVGQRFDRVDAAQQDMQTGMDTGFQAQQAAIGDLNTNVNDNFNALGTQATEGFAQVGQSLSDLDTNTQATLGNVQNNVLTGQSVIYDNLGQMADTNAVYYDDLAQRQQDIQQGQDDFRSTFDDYVTRYGEDTALANQTRNDLQAGLATGVSNIRNQIGTVADAQAQQAAANQGYMQQQFGSLVQQMAPDTIVRSRDFARLAAQNTSLDPTVRQDMFLVGQSFDDSGNLIMNNVDPLGNTIARNIDNNGLLNIRTYDPTGQVSGQRQVNLNNAFSIVNSLQNSTLPPA